MQEKNTESSTSKSSEQIVINNPKEMEGKQTPSEEDEFLSLINNLLEFETYTKSLKSVNEIITKENFNFFKKLSLKENIKINLILSKIYMNIISNESLYKEYLVSISEKDKYKWDILLQLIDNCVSLVDQLKTFAFSEELFQFKMKIIDLLKCIYYNCKKTIQNEEKLQKMLELMDSLPKKFFSETYLELNKSKELYEVCKTKETYKINDFEDKFSEINNYYEQLDAFKKFVENNSGIVNCSSFDEEKINIKAEILDFKPNYDKIEFYEQYGTLLLKFCKYHNYMFLDKEEEEEKENKIEPKVIDEEENEEENDENIRMVFLLDKIDQEKYEDEEDKNKKIENLLKNKQFVSSFDSKEYDDLIKKEINYYLSVTKNIEKDPKIKTVRDHLSYYLSTLDVESYYPLYLKDFTKISISDNFTPNYLTNVPAGQVGKFYFETEPDEDTLAYIEFSLEDKTKDINFELNKYELNCNKFINIFKEEKIENTFKCFVFCHGYSLYEIVFDNYYSWFNSKDINYRISLLKLTENSRKQEQNHFSFKVNGKNYSFNGTELEIEKKEEEEKILNIPVVFHLNSLQIVSFKKNEMEKEKEKENKIENENDKKEKNEKEEKDGYELVFKEHKSDEEEKIVPKHLFNYLMINHIKKLKVQKDKNYKLLISIFSKNRDLPNICEELKEEIENEENNDVKNYLKNIGFYPDEKIDKFKVEYKLYDLDEEILTYHVFFNITKDVKISKFILLIDFDKSVANAALYYKGEILTKLKEQDINFNNIEYDKIDEIYNLIKTVSENYKGIELILCQNNNLEEEDKKNLGDIIGNIKTFCQEKLDPPVKIFEYEKNEIIKSVIKFTNSLYEK